MDLIKQNCTEIIQFMKVASNDIEEDKEYIETRIRDQIDRLEIEFHEIMTIKICILAFQERYINGSGTTLLNFEGGHKERILNTKDDEAKIQSFNRSLVTFISRISSHLFGNATKNDEGVHPTNCNSTKTPSQNKINLSKENILLKSISKPYWTPTQNITTSAVA